MTPTDPNEPAQPVVAPANAAQVVHPPAYAEVVVGFGTTEEPTRHLRVTDDEERAGYVRVTIGVETGLLPALELARLASFAQDIVT